MKKRIISAILVASFVVASAFSANAATIGSKSVTPVGVTDPKEVKTKLVKPASMDLKDICRLLTKVMPDMKKKGLAQHQAKEPVTIVNAKKLDVAGLEWVVRLQFGTPDAEGRGAIYEDYHVTTLGYYADNRVPNDPKYYVVYNDGRQDELVYSYDRTLQLYGKDLGEKTKGTAYYFGLFDEGGSHEICGFGVATRVKRWPAWFDRSFSYENQLVEFKGKWYVKGEFVGCADRDKYVVGSYDQDSHADFLTRAGLELKTNAAGEQYYDYIKK